MTKPSVFRLQPFLRYSFLFLVCCVLLLLEATPLFGQNTIYSPYSAFGYGNREQIGLARNFGMGNIGYATISRDHISPLNPASYTELIDVTFDLSAYYNSTTLSNEQQSDVLNTGGVQGIAVAFPTNKSLAFSFGLLPYSQKGYSVSAEQTLVTDTITRSVNTDRNGQGGLNDFYLGASFRLFKQLNVGIQAGYVFGKLNETYRTESATLSSIAEFEQNDIIRAFYVQPGLIFSDTISRKKITTQMIQQAPDSAEAARLRQKRARRSGAGKKFDKWIWRVGASGAYFFSANSRQRLVSFASGIRDTLRESENVEVTLPTRVGVGASLEAPMTLYLGLDAEFEQWEAVAFNQQQDAEFQNSFRVAAGAEWIPDWRAVRKFHKRIAYRAGLSYQRGSLILRNQPLNQYAFHAGIGIPVIKIKRSSDFFSRFNIGVRYASRGTTDQGLIQENSWQVVLGVSFTQRWFQQWKYD